MKPVRALVALTTAALTFWRSEAEAYRPFDGTDAAVEETGEIEVELGHERRSARSRYRRHARKPLVESFTQFDHIDDTLGRPRGCDAVDDTSEHNPHAAIAEMKEDARAEEPAG